MIVLCIGQAGCQIGNCFVDFIDKRNYLSLINDGGYIPIIFADFDAKVIRKSHQSASVSRLVKKVNVIKGSHSCSNGFPNFKEDEKFIQNIIDHLRDEIIKQGYACSKSVEQKAL